MVMGNASGREQGESSSVANNNGDEELMEFAQPVMPQLSYHTEDAYPHHLPRVYQPPLMFPPQGLPSTRTGETMHILNNATEQKTDVFNEKRSATMIKWSHGGTRVAITGSWDGWLTIEPMQSLGKEFVIVKMLPLGVYHYRFIVDQQLHYAPELPWEFDGSGAASNVLDLQDYIPESSEHLSAFESPPSPASSYDNLPLQDSDFVKPPPELPSQIQMKSVNEPKESSVTRRPSSSSSSSSRPHYTVLNHLYLQNSPGGNPVALGSTFRFKQKYVTVVLYKASRR